MKKTFFFIAFFALLLALPDASANASVYKAGIEINTDGATVNDLICAPIKQRNRDKYAYQVRRELDKYPQTMLSEMAEFCDIEIVLTDEITTIIGGVPDTSCGTFCYIPAQNKAVIIIDVSYIEGNRKDYSIATIHHEMMHLIEMFIRTSDSFSTEWAVVNPDGFKYTTIQREIIPDEYLYSKYGQVLPHSLFTARFITNYAATSPAEDRADTWEYIMSRPLLFLRNQYLETKTKFLFDSIEKRFGPFNVKPCWEKRYMTYFKKLPCKNEIIMLPK